MRAAPAQRSTAAGQPDPAKHVVPQQIRDERQERRDEQVGQHQPVERQIERVEAQIAAELRIGDAEVTAVQEQLHPDPVALRDQHPASRPMKTGTPIPNSRNRASTVVR